MSKIYDKMLWKNVQVENSQLTAEGLIGVEECLDYSILQSNQNEQSSKRKHSNSTDKKKKKRKISAQVPTEEIILTPSKSGSSFIVDEENDNLEEYQTWKNFGLPDLVIKGLEEQGFKEPTVIQSLTLPAALLGRRDILGAAETGSGKTLAFGLPIISGILNEKQQITENEKPLYALILTPTRELAIQIKNHLVAAAKFTDIKVAVVVGGMAAVKQERILNKGPEIVVATPGRLWELIQQGNIHLSQIEGIKYLAIDETDRMLEKGHFEELHNILERLNFDKTKMENRQNFVFSATLTLVHDLPKYLTNKSKMKKVTPEQKLQQIIQTLGITNPKIVDITEQGTVPETLTESRISCAFDEKDFYVYYFLQKYPGRTLIFCNSIGCVKRLSNLLNILLCHPLPLHASMQQRQRLKNLEKFRDNENSVLIATDVAARGLDIPNVEHVLHYQLPRTSEGYIHRSGRTARAFRKGLTLILMEPSEIKTYIKLCKTLDKSEDVPLFPIEDDYLKSVKERVHLARELDKMELEIRKGNSEDGWLQKAAKEMDIIVDDFVKKYDTDEMGPKKKLAANKRKFLSSLLIKPIFPKGFSGKYPQKFSTETSGMIKASKGRKKNIPLFKPRKTVNRKK